MQVNAHARRAGSVGRSDLADAVRQPVDSKPLRELAAGARTAVIAVDDITRPTPAHDGAAAGSWPSSRVFRTENIRILVALGAHRPMVRAELERKLGAAILDEFDVEQHHPVREPDRRSAGRAAARRSG